MTVAIVADVVDMAVGRKELAMAAVGSVRSVVRAAQSQHHADAEQKPPEERDEKEQVVPG